MAVEEPTDDDKGSVFVPNVQLDNSSNPEEDSRDEELTNLTWLQDTNLLKNFQMGSYGIEGEEVLSDCPSSECLDETVEHVTINGEEEGVSPPGSHSPYNPSLHAHSKPPFSFSCLIFMAIEDSPHKALPVKNIYDWIVDHFPYFRDAPTGWKNSVRHNLSLSKCFRKVDKEKGQNVGKGSLWCIDPEFRPNLLQALQKAPSMAHLEFSHFSYTCHNGKSDNEIKPCLLVSSEEAVHMPSPELFPYLSRRLASSIKDPEVDAAATMLTLKHGPTAKIQNASEECENDTVQYNQKLFRKRMRLKPSNNPSKKPKLSKPVITTIPSEDHTYSACLDNEQPPGCTNGWSEPQNKNGASPRNNADEEGAHALLNLAEIASKRLFRKFIRKTSTS